MRRTARYFAADWLVPDPTPGQLRVREIAAEARDDRELCQWLHRDRSLIDDPVTGQRAGASAALRAYAEAQNTYRPARSQEKQPLPEPVTIRTVIPGGWDHDQPLPLFASPGARCSQTLWELFHDGVVPDDGEPFGSIYLAEQLLHAGGGSHRTMAHVLAGVMLPTGIGDFYLRDGPPDPELLSRLHELDVGGVDVERLRAPWSPTATREVQQELYGAWRAEVMAPR